MTPKEFFETAVEGSIVTYDPRCGRVRITCLSRADKYARGRELTTHRSVFLWLSNQMLKEGHRAAFSDIVLVA